MTAIMPEVDPTQEPNRPDEAELWAELWAALDVFTKQAERTSHIPVPVIKALRSSEPVVASVICRGFPITLSKDAGKMTYEDISLAWGRVREMEPPPGVHVHITAGAEARVDTILYTHKSQPRGGAV